MHYGLKVVLVCLHITLSHYYPYADVSEGIELLKCLSGTFCRVCVSQLSFVQYMGLCVFSLPHLSYDDNANTCTLYVIIIIKSEVWSICHCLRLGRETVTCAVCRLYSYADSVAKKRTTTICLQSVKETQKNINTACYWKAECVAPLLHT